MFAMRGMPAGDLRIRAECNNFLSRRQRTQAGAHHRTSSRRIPSQVSHSNSANQVFRPIDVIRKKRDGMELSSSEIQGLVAEYTNGKIPDYQVSAWLMAVVLRGMSRAETTVLTEAMLHSGEVLDLSSLPGKKVDKHS